MPFYNRSGELDGKLYTRTYREEVEIALSGLDGVLNGEKAFYASSELTTGRRHYELLADRGLGSGDSLRQALGEEEWEELLWRPNSAAANAFARRLEKSFGGRHRVVTPAPFEVRGWSQPEYLAFWEMLLRTRISRAFFNDGWQYSNGCTFEYAVAHDAGLDCFTASGEPLDPEAAAGMVRAAIDDLRARGFEPETLEAHLSLLPSAAARS